MKKSVCLRCGHEGELAKSHILPKWAGKLALNPETQSYGILIGGGRARKSQSNRWTRTILCVRCEQSTSEIDRKASNLLREPKPEYFQAWAEGKPVLLAGEDCETLVDFVSFTCWKFLAESAVEADLDLRMVPTARQMRDFPITVQFIDAIFPRELAPSTPICAGPLCTSPSTNDFCIISFAAAGFLCALAIADTKSEIPNLRFVANVETMQIAIQPMPAEAVASFYNALHEFTRNAHPTDATKRILSEIRKRSAKN